MRTSEERIALLYERATVLRRREDEKRLILTGGASGTLLAVLLTVMLHLDLRSGGTAGNQFTGASLLGESAGGYVLVAVIAFVVAVVSTVLCLRSRVRQAERRDAPKENPDEERDRLNQG